MKTTRELEHSIRSCKDPSALLEQEELSLTEYLRILLDQRSLSVIEVIRRCNLERSYGYQLFNGTRRPTRDILLTMALQLELSEVETQRILKLAGRPVLYARNRRDAAILYSISHHLTPVQTEELLSELGVHSLARGV